MNLDDPKVVELLGAGLTSELEYVFGQMEWAEDEIDRARGTAHRDVDDPVWQAFKLLTPTSPQMRTEFVYRAHCRQILARVKAGEDTRPATDVEIVCGISSASQSTPITGAVVGLMARLFKSSFPDEAGRADIDVGRYDPVEMDEWERRLRHRGRQEWRC